MKHSIWTYLLAIASGVLIGVLILGTTLHSWEPRASQENVGDQLHFKHTMDLGHFRSNDGATLPLTIRLLYDSTDPGQAARLRGSIYLSVSKECMKWTLMDALQKDNQLGTKLATLIEDGNRPAELIQITILQGYSDRDKYIKEHFPYSADRMIQELKDKESGAGTDSLAREQQKVVIEAQRIVSEYQQSMLQFEASPAYQKALKEWNSTHPVIGDRKRLELQKAMAQKMMESEAAEMNKTHKQMSNSNK